MGFMAVVSGFQSTDGANHVIGLAAPQNPGLHSTNFVTALPSASLDSQESARHELELIFEGWDTEWWLRRERNKLE